MQGFIHQQYCPFSVLSSVSVQERSPQSPTKRMLDSDEDMTTTANTTTVNSPCSTGMPSLGEKWVHFFCFGVFCGLGEVVVRYQARKVLVQKGCHSEV